METRTPGEGVPPASKAGQRLHCAGRVGHCRRRGDQTRPEEPWVPHAPDFLLPTEKAFEGHGSRSTGLSGFRKPGPRPVSGVGSARPPLGVPSPSLRASVGASQAEQHGGPRAQERKARGAGGRGAGGSGTRAQGLYRPAPRAAAALLRGSGSCTIVSGRREGGCRAPAPPPPARAIPEGPGGGSAAGSTVARSHRGRRPRVSPPAPTARRQLGFSWASASLGRGFLPFLERGSCYAPTSRK